MLYYWGCHDKPTTPTIRPYLLELRPSLAPQKSTQRPWTAEDEELVRAAREARSAET